MDLSQDTFRKNLIKFRRSAYLSQERLAEMCDLSKQQIYRIESGKSWPPPATITKLARALGVHESDLHRPQESEKRAVHKMTLEELSLAVQELKEHNRYLERENQKVKWLNKVDPNENEYLIDLAKRIPIDVLEGMAELFEGHNYLALRDELKMLKEQKAASKKKA